jgi:hypothetical protein
VVPRVQTRAERRVLRGRAEAQLLEVGLGDDRRTRGAQPRDRDALLRELGCDDAEIAALERDGAFGT